MLKWWHYKRIIITRQHACQLFQLEHHTDGRTKCSMYGRDNNYLKSVVSVSTSYKSIFFQGSKTFWSGIYKIIFIKYLNSVFNCSRVHCIYTSTIDFFHKLYEQQSVFFSWNSIDTPTRVKSIKTSSRSNFRTLNDYTYTNYNLNDFVENCPSVVQDFYQQKRGNPR